MLSLCPCAFFRAARRTKPKVKYSKKSFLSKTMIINILNMLPHTLSIAGFPRDSEHFGAPKCFCVLLCKYSGIYKRKKKAQTKTTTLIYNNSLYKGEEKKSSNPMGFFQVMQNFVRGKRNTCSCAFFLPIYSITYVMKYL